MTDELREAIRRFSSHLSRTIATAQARQQDLIAADPILAGSIAAMLRELLEPAEALDRLDQEGGKDGP